MSEMTDRVAKAIYECEPHINAGEPIAWDDLQGPLRRVALIAARAAIEAMREPTPEMRLAVQCREENYLDPGQVDEWAVMIDAALKGE